AREPETPDIPTIGEAGIPDVEMEGYYGLLAPEGTPESVLDKLSSDIAEVMKMQSVTSKIRALGMHVVANSRKEFSAKINADLKKFDDLTREAGLTNLNQ